MPNDACRWPGRLFTITASIPVFLTAIGYILLLLLHLKRIISNGSFLLGTIPHFTNSSLNAAWLCSAGVFVPEFRKEAGNFFSKQKSEFRKGAFPSAVLVLV